MNDILILMSDNREINKDINNADYNTLTSIINFNYAIKNNYDFIYYIPTYNNEITIFNCLSPTNELRHAAWSKLLSVIKTQQLEKKYKYIVYLDSDCIIHNQNITILDYLINSKNTKNEFLDLNSEFFFMNSQPWDFELPCSGFFIIKQTESVLDFFKQWYMDNNNPLYNTKHIWEQFSLQYNIFPNQKNKIQVINDWMFREKPNQFLRHIGSEEKQNRIPFFKNYLTNNISQDIISKFNNELDNIIIKYETSNFF